MHQSLSDNPLTICCFVALTQVTMAQDPPAPPPPEGGHGMTENDGPRGIPIDGGLTIFLVFAAGYAGRELLKSRKRKLDTEV